MLESGQTEEQKIVKVILMSYWKNLWDDLDQRPIRYGRSIDEEFLS